MRKYITALIIFSLSFFIYFGVATQFTFQPKWVLDYFNPLAQSLLHGRLDLPNPVDTYDLSSFHDRWYAPWGILPALILIPIHIVMNRFIPTIYLSVFFASLNIVLMYLLFLRIKKEFFPEMSHVAIVIFLTLFAFGTTHFYVGTLGSVWHTDQMISSFLGVLGFFIIFKRKKRIRDYAMSAFILSLSLIGRATTVLLMSLPVVLYYWQYIYGRKLNRYLCGQILLRGFLVFGIPLLIMSTIFFTYNYLRFQNPFEYGYSHISESPMLEDARLKYGSFSLKHIPRNLWFMVLEIPGVWSEGRLNLSFNVYGNSIFFLTPSLLAIFLALPFHKIGNKFKFDPYVGGLWIASITTILPSLMLYATGWIQFGYRYSLDITALLVVLSIFGVRGKPSMLYTLGVGFSILMYVIGIDWLM